VVVNEAASVDLLLRHGRVITMDAERRILVDGAIAIAGGRVAAIGPDRDIAPRVQAAATRDLAGALVHPGLVDAHVHPSNDISRGFAPKLIPDMTPIDMAMFTWPDSPEIDHLGSLHSSMEMVANGTTLFSDTGSAFHLDQAVRAFETVGIRAVTGSFLFGDAGLSGEQADVRGIADDEAELLRRPYDQCVELIVDQLERYPFRGDGLVRGAVTLYGCGRASDRLLLEGQALAARHGAPMIIHQHWGPDETAASQALFGRAPIEHLSDIGVLGPNLTLVHMIHLSPSELELLYPSGAKVVHCPGASMRRGMGAIRIGHFPEMLAAGVTVGLGSDGYLNKRDVLRQAFLSILAHREVRADYPILTAETVLEMATLHGARALGMEREVGSLEVGKRADIVIHRSDRPEAHPRYRDPVDSLVLFRQTSTVDTVFVGGEAVLEGGRFTKFDAADAWRQIDGLAGRLEERVGRNSFSQWPVID
jgi:cytosine/adenosine deaminase-related metal-dependent hydrolase